MTVLKIVLSAFMFATVITATALIFSNEKEEAQPIKEYVLRYEDGQVSLFENGELTESFENINYDVLPFVDRDSLKKGIKTSSYEEILSIVEDFDG